MGVIDSYIHKKWLKLINLELLSVWRVQLQFLAIASCFVEKGNEIFLEINPLGNLEGLWKGPFVNEKVNFNLKELTSFSVPAEGKWKFYLFQNKYLNDKTKHTGAR